MAGFYGGPRGASFEIKKTYDSFSDLYAVETIVGEGLQNGDWIMISCPPGKVIFGNYQASLWQVTSIIDYPYDPEKIDKNKKRIILNPKTGIGLFGIKTNDTHLYFRLINSGFGSNTSGDATDELIVYGGSSTKGINVKGGTPNDNT